MIEPDINRTAKKPTLFIDFIRRKYYPLAEHGFIDIFVPDDCNIDRLRFIDIFGSTRLDLVVTLTARNKQHKSHERECDPQKHHHNVHDM